MRALIIDDSKAVRTAVRNHLTDLGFETREAEDGIQALEQLKTHGPFDLATVDWQMPRMTGLEFIEAARQCSEYDGVKMLMVTTLNNLQQVARALRTGADEYLMKPITREMLEKKLVLMEVLTPCDGVSL